MIIITDNLVHRHAVVLEKLEIAGGRVPWIAGRQLQRLTAVQFQGGYSLDIYIPQISRATDQLQFWTVPLQTSKEFANTRCKGPVYNSYIL